MPKPARCQRRTKPQPRGGCGVIERRRDHLERLGRKQLDNNLDAHLAWVHDHTSSALVLRERVFGDTAPQRRQRCDPRLRRGARAEWFVIDDDDLGQLRRRDDAPIAAHMRFHRLDHRHDQAATAITSTIKLGEWAKYLGDATLAATALDRLAMTPSRIARLELPRPSGQAAPRTEDCR